MYIRLYIHQQEGLLLVEWPHLYTGQMIIWLMNIKNNSSYYLFICDPWVGYHIVNYILFICLSHNIYYVLNINN